MKQSQLFTTAEGLAYKHPPKNRSLRNI